MSLTLYHHPISTCSQKVRIALAEKGLDFESRIIDLASGENLSEWYLSINPNGVVPSLSNNEDVIIDSSVICEYLEECFPETSLAPKDPVGRAHMRAWMRYFEEVPTTAIRVPSFNTFFLPVFQNLPEAAIHAQAEKRPLRKHFYRELGNVGFSEQRVDESMERLRSCLVRVDGAIRENGPWLLGSQFTIADIVLIPSIIRMADLKLEDQWTDLPDFKAWLTAVTERPSFSKAFYEGSRLTTPPISSI